MRVSAEELLLLNAACANLTNTKAQELVNVLGTKSAEDIVRLLAQLPIEVRGDLERHVREAIDEQRRRAKAR